MKAVDSSVTVPAFASWHEHHESARSSVAGARFLPAHVALETFAVLTRLPPPHRVSGAAVRTFLEANFSVPWLSLDGRGHQSLVEELASRALAGGAVYDAVVAFTARQAGATLLSADRRARPTYDAMGATVEMII